MGRIQVIELDSRACWDMMPREEQPPLMIYFTPICKCNCTGVLISP